MIFTETKLKGAFIIDLERREDDRGSFARAFCQREFGQRGLKPVIARRASPRIRRKGTLRGMHSNSRRRPRPSSCAARAAPSSTSSSIAAGEPNLP